MTHHTGTDPLGEMVMEALAGRPTEIPVPPPAAPARTLVTAGVTLAAVSALPVAALVASVVMR